MPLPVIDRRPDSYRHRARELIAAAWREDDKARRKHLLNLAATYERAADEIMPLPAEPPIFRKP